MLSKFTTLFLFFDTFVTAGVWEGITGGVWGSMAYVCEEYVDFLCIKAVEVVCGSGECRMA